MSLADRIVVMEGGRIRQVGRPSRRLRSAGRPVRRDLRRQPGHEPHPRRSDRARADEAEVRLPRGWRRGSRLPTAGARRGRPDAGHSLRACVTRTPEGPIAGNVVTEEYLGNARNLHVQAPFGRLVMRTASGAVRARGSEVRLRLDPTQVSLFDRATEERL